MIKRNIKKTNIKKEEINIQWNQELFKGMKYSEIVQFKKKYKKLIITHYELAAKKAEVESKLLSAKDKFLNKEKAKKAAPKNFRIVVGGFVIATVCLATSVTFAENNDNYVAVNTVSTATAETTISNDITTEATKENNIEIAKESYNDIENVSTETDIENSYTHEYSNDVEVKTYEVVKENIAPSTEATTTVEIVPVAEEKIIENNYKDIVIFDKALEMLLKRCETSENGAVFKGDYSPSYVPLMGTFILPEYEDMAGYKVAGWFENYFGSEVTTYNLKYNTSFSIKEGGAKFENTLDGFKVYIDKNAIEASVNLDLKDAEEASIRAGVSQQLRDYLLSEECQQFLPSMHKLMSGVHSNVKSDLLKSDDFLNSIKSSIETELKDLTTWDVQVVFN